MSNTMNFSSSCANDSNSQNSYNSRHKQTHSEIKKEKLSSDYNGGAVIDVSPNGTWLAWFKNLPVAKSPQTLSRYRTALSQSSTMRRLKFPSYFNNKYTDISDTSFKDVPTEKDISLGHFLKKNSCDSANRSCDLNDEESIAQSKFENNPFRNKSINDDSKYEVQTAAAESQNIDHHIIDSNLEKNVSYNKVSQKFKSYSKRKLKSLINFAKKHPIIFLFLIVVKCLLIVLIFLIIFLWAIPYAIQNSLDSSTMQIVKSVISNPNDSSFSIYMDTLISRSFSKYAKLDSFQAQIYYKPNQDTSLYTSSHNRALSQSGKKVTYTKLQKQLDHVNRILQNDVIQKEKKYLLGHLTIPQLILKSFNSKNVYNSVVQIDNIFVFNSFLIELINQGRAEWILESNHITVNTMGLKYTNFDLSKSIQIQGPKLVQKKPEVQQALNEFDLNHVDPLLKLNGAEENIFRLVLFDLTKSTSHNVKIHVTAEVDNSQSHFSIDSLGYVVFSELYNNQQLFNLYSKHTVSLMQGKQAIKFHGEIPILEDYNVYQRKAIIELFEKIFKGETPVIETRGVSTTVPLYSSIMKYIRLYTPLELNNLDSNLKHQSPFIRNIDIKLMELKADANSKNVLQIETTGTITIANPFGEQGPLENIEIELTGTLAYETPDSLKQLYQIATVKGSIKGLGQTKSSLTYMNIGALKVNLHTIDINLNMYADLLNEGKELTEYIRLTLRNDMVLRLINVNALVKFSTPLGLIQLHNIPINQRIQMTGIKGFNNIKLKEFNIVQIPMLAPSESVEVIVTVIMPSKSAVKTYLGTLGINLSFKGSYVGYVEATDCILKPGDNIYKFRGILDISEKTSPQILPLISNIMQSGVIKLDGEFVDKGSDSQNINTPTWIKKALIGTKITIPWGNKDADSGKNPLIKVLLNSATAENSVTKS